MKLPAHANVVLSKYLSYAIKLKVQTQKIQIEKSFEVRVIVLSSSIKVATILEEATATVMFFRP